MPNNDIQDAHFYADHPREEMHQFIPAGATRLLDVGCHIGGFSVGLKASREIEVWGIEPNEDSASKCEGRLDRIINSTFDGSADLPDRHFDVIMFNDVLEHMVDPWAALDFAHSKLIPGGCVVVSLPNVLHIDNLLHMLRERDFRYEEWGVRDKTHVRFFTRISSRRMFESCGYEVVQEKGINKNWWTRSILRRVAFWLFSKKLEETKYIQNAFVLRSVR